MKFKKQSFNSWLLKNQPQITNPKKYSQTIGTISNHLKKQNINKTGLELVDDYDDAKRLKKLYFSNQELNQKDVTGNRMYSRSFDLYLEYLKT